ncbi:MAG: hypothetical protein OEW68_00475 [Gammaproteobacteria bacterium]|nr:hypothetical protein [Gammaproteobacteria bacterium]MDH4313298.1 hypothetical protein [Gammaproteobacteria bacterium]MDH5212901.1 hypothetical protein [Gammaproteobacteria bacterium]MDH5499787.1 hypothetical protein [Gammaproteobacteria bacterium]
MILRARPQSVFQRVRNSPIAFILTALALLPSQASIAAGTAAGTVIDNTAQLTYDIGGTPLSLNSNTVSVTVDERIDVVVTLQSPQVLVAGGDSNRSLLFRVTNTGNGSEDFLLAIDSNLTGDDFDPVPAVPAIYFDTDSSGDLSAGDVAYNPGVNDPQLAADAFIDILLLNDIPLSAANGETGLSQLTATSTTGSGNPGDVFANQGDGGSDAVVGTSGGQAADVGEYLVSDVAVSIVKSVLVADPFGGTQPVPGATLTYTITVEVTNSGTASGSAVNDPVPANTTYVPASIRLNGSTLTDSPDADAGEFDTVGVPSIVVRLGDLTQLSGPQTVTFQVTID